MMHTPMDLGNRWSILIGPLQKCEGRDHSINATFASIHLLPVRRLPGQTDPL